MVNAKVLKLAFFVGIFVGHFEGTKLGIVVGPFVGFKEGRDGRHLCWNIGWEM